MAQSQTSRFEFANEDGTTVSAHLHMNPNGEVGGWVADTATVGDNATIEAGAIVGPNAVVAPGKIVKEGQLITAA